MNHYQLAKEASDTAWTLRSEPLEFDDLFPDMSDEDAARLWLVIDEWSKTVSMVRSIVGDEWVSRCDSRGGGLTIDGFYVGSKKGYTAETCVDADGFLNWLVIASQTDTGLLRRVLNPNQVRKGSLPPAVRETFFEKEHREKPDTVPKPTVIPVDVLDG